MMTTPIQNALNLGRRAIKSLSGREATLTVAGVGSGVITVTRGETTSDDVDNEGNIVRVRLMDFLVDKEDYKIGGLVIVPEEGHEITIGGETWRAMPTPSEPEFRRSDRDGTRWRIHTKKVA